MSASPCSFTSRIARDAGYALKAARSNSAVDPGIKAINLGTKAPLVETERSNIAVFRESSGQ